MKVKTEAGTFENIKSLDRYFALSQPYGSVDKAVTTMLHGIIQSKVSGITSPNKYRQGYVFVTRPQLNMSAPNLARESKFISLLNDNTTSLQHYVRCLLDPRFGAKPENKTPLLNNKNAFIPIFTNTLENLTGWPQITLPTYTSKSGMRKEQYIQADGVTEILEAFDLDFTFADVKSSPILMILQTWIAYMANIFEGTMSPYWDLNLSNEKDYDCRVYRFVMDEADTHIEHMACCGAGFPITDPSAKLFDFNSKTNYIEGTKSINMRMRVTGALYNDPIIAKWFNKTTLIHSPDMINIINANFENSPTHTYEKVTPAMMNVYRGLSLPLINTETNELTWWVDMSTSDWVTNNNNTIEDAI